MDNQMLNEKYKYLNAPLPVIMRQPLKTNSLFQLCTPSIEQNRQVMHEHQQLQKNTQSYTINKKHIHQIGSNLVDLFANPIYHSNKLVNITDNTNFGCLKTTQNNQQNLNVHIINDQNTLSFQSRFQSGNLAVVSKFNNNNYYLALQKDINSLSNTTQWFYYKINNKNILGPITFHIVNYVKPFSTFKLGMKPCIFSTKKGKKWLRGGYNITYSKNSIFYQQDKSYYTLSFTYQFTQIDDQTYFAYSYPYTYTRLIKFLDQIQVKHSDKMKRKSIAKTLGNNSVEMITITNPQYSNKKVMYITSRVHPGQTVSSYVCESIILFLLSKNEQAIKLRSQFIIKIIPMLNPDGVINGCYRCSLSGDDLNRQWKNPNKSMHSQIYYTKKSIVQHQMKKILYLDIHGHSKKKASFMYGCLSPKNPYIPKQLLYVLSKKMQHFNYYSCNFSQPKSKQGTSRIQMWKSGIDFSYTYQISFCGPQRQKRHFNLKDFEIMGIQLCKNLCLYFYSRLLQYEINKQINKQCQQFYANEVLMNFGNQDTNGSSSELEDQAIKQVQTQIKQQKPLYSRRKYKQHTNTQIQTKKINSLLQNYAQRFQQKMKINQQIIEQKIIKKQIQSKKIIQKDNLFRSRQSFMATKINLQQMSTKDKFYPCNSTFYGLSAQKDPNSLQKTKSISFKKHFSQSSNINDKKKIISEQNGILFPNLQKNNYKKYQRYKQNQIISQRSSKNKHIYDEIQIVKHLSASLQHKPHKQITLVQRIKSRINQMHDTKF